MTTRKSFSGAAIKTTISSGAFNAGATTLSLTSATGWPTTVNGPFIATIDRGLATQEQISVGARSGLACSVITRGYAGTAEVSHAANATIEHGWDAIAADEANRIASLLTTKGDGLGHDGTQVQREPVGTAGYYQTATPAASTGRSWTAPPSSLVTAKGQVLAASASGVLAPSNTPANNQVLIGDTTQTAGVRFGTYDPSLVGVAWTNYTTTWSGTIGNGQLLAAYRLIDAKSLVFRIRISWGSSTTHPAANQTLTLPNILNAVYSDFAIVGVSTCLQTGVNAWFGHSFLVTQGATTISINAGVPASGAVQGVVTNLVPFTWANFHQLYVTGNVVEIA